MESPCQSEFSLLNSMILGMDQCCCKDDNENDDTPEIWGCGKLARVSHLPVQQCPFKTGVLVSVQCRVLRQLQQLSDYGHGATGASIFPCS